VSSDLPSAALARLSLLQLRYFVAVAEELHFGRAAKRLGLSQPPLSKNIQALEQNLNLQLLQRDKRNVELTSAGRVLLQEARGLLAHAQRVRSIMHGVSDGTQGEVYIGTVPFAMFGTLPKFIRQFRRTSPSVSVSIEESHTGSVIAGVIDGRFDFGVVWSSPLSGHVQSHTLVKGGFVAAMPTDDPLLHKSALHLADLKDRPLVLPSRQVSPHHHDIILSEFNRAGIVPRIATEVSAIMSQLGYVASGLGTAIVPYSAIDVPNLDVRFRNILDFQRECHLTLVWSERVLGEASRRFLDTVRDIAPAPDTA